MNILFTALEQALIFSPLVFGMYVSYKILNVTDLTVDGTYVLGAAVFAQTLNYGLLIAMTASISVGALVGIIVSQMQKNNIVNALIVGVLSSFMLYSVNLQVMGRPNISLLGKATILSYMNVNNWIIPLIIISLCLAMCLIFLLRTRLGLTLRAFGQDQKLLGALGKSVERYRLIGLALSNSLAALTGAIAAQFNGFADINMGLGVALIGIGAVVIGRQIIIKDEAIFNPKREIIACFIGVILYFTCLGFLLRLGINPVNLKLVLGLLLFFSLRKIYSGAKK